MAASASWWVWLNRAMFIVGLCKTTEWSQTAVRAGLDEAPSSRRGRDGNVEMRNGPLPGWVCAVRSDRCLVVVYLGGVDCADGSFAPNASSANSLTVKIARAWADSEC